MRKRLTRNITRDYKNCTQIIKIFDCNKKLIISKESLPNSDDVSYFVNGIGLIDIYSEGYQFNNGIFCNPVIAKRIERIFDALNRQAILDIAR